LLPRYRKVSPDNVYYYAISARSSRIDGLLIHDVPAPAMAEIRGLPGEPRFDAKALRRQIPRQSDT
jgi:hypothetical protein